MPTTTRKSKSNPTTAVKEVAVSAAKRAAQAVTTDQKKRLAEQSVRAAERALAEAIRETQGANVKGADEKMADRARRAIDKAKEARVTARERAKEAGLPAPKFAALPRIRRTATAKPSEPTQEKPKKGAEKPARPKATQKGAAPAPAPGASEDGTLCPKARDLEEFGVKAGWFCTVEQDGNRAHLTFTKDEERVEAWFIDNKQDVSISPRYTRADGSVVLLRNMSACRKQMGNGPDDRPVPTTRQPRAIRKRGTVIRGNDDEKPRKSTMFDPATSSDDEIAEMLSGKMITWRTNDGVMLSAIAGRKVTISQHPRKPGPTHRIASFWEQLPSKRGMVSGGERHVAISQVWSLR